MGKIRYGLYDNPSRKNGQKRYHVRVSNPQRMSFEEVCEMINHASSPTKGDVKGVVDGLSYVLTAKLSEGSSVHIAGIGYFSIGIAEPGVDDPEELNGKQVTVKTIHFEPDVELMNKLLENTTFERSQAYNISSGLSDAEMKQKLRQYFEENDCITAKEFRLLMKLTRATAYRRLQDLCKGPFPIFRRMGGTTSSVYVLGKDAEWKLK